MSLKSIYLIAAAASTTAASVPDGTVAAQRPDVVDVGSAAVHHLARGGGRPGAVIIHPQFGPSADTISREILQIAEVTTAIVKSVREAVRCVAPLVCYLPDAPMLLLLSQPRVYGVNAEITLDVWQNIPGTRGEGALAVATRVRLFLRRAGDGWAVVREEIETGAAFPKAARQAIFPHESVFYQGTPGPP